MCLRAQPDGCEEEEVSPRQPHLFLAGQVEDVRVSVWVFLLCVPRVQVEVNSVHEY